MGVKHGQMSCSGMQIDGSTTCMCLPPKVKHPCLTHMQPCRGQAPAVLTSNYNMCSLCVRKRASSSRQQNEVPLGPENDCGAVKGQDR